MKNNLRLYLMSALCCVALTNEPGYSMHAIPQKSTQQQKLLTDSPTFFLANHSESQQPIAPSIKQISDLITKNINKPNIGLLNIGATCYMNATLQAFANLQNFTKSLIKDVAKYLNTKFPLELEMNHVIQFARVLANLNTLNNFDSNTKYVSPSEYHDLLSQTNELFKNRTANDSKDLVNHLILSGHNALNHAQPNIINDNNITLDQRNQQLMFNIFCDNFRNQNRSVFSDHFYGVNCNTTQCFNCKTRIYNYQTYFFIVFPLAEVTQYKKSSSFYNNILNFYPINNNNCVNLVDCFNYDQKGTLLDRENSMYCNYCKRNSKAVMKTRLTTLPKTLILLFNRGKGIEFDINVQLPEYIDLTQYVSYSGNAKRYLSSVICHFGNSGNDGHFICYARKSPTSKWYKYNDSIVSGDDGEIQKVLTGNLGRAYLAFYTEMPNNNIQNNLVNNNNNQLSFNNPQQSMNYNQNNNMIDSNTVKNITIDMDYDKLQKYFNQSTEKRQVTLNESQIEKLYPLVNYYYKDVNLETYLQDNNVQLITSILNTLLRETIKFLNEYSTSTNKELCNRFAKVWNKFRMYLEKRKTKPGYDTLCRKVNDIGWGILQYCGIYIYHPNSGQNTEQFNSININHNMNNTNSINNNISQLNEAFNNININDNINNINVQGINNNISQFNDEFNNININYDMNNIGRNRIKTSNQWNNTELMKTGFNTLLDSNCLESVFMNTLSTQIKQFRKYREKNNLPRKTMSNEIFNSQYKFIKDYSNHLKTIHDLQELKHHINKLLLYSIDFRSQYNMLVSGNEKYYTILRQAFKDTIQKLEQFNNTAVLRTNLGNILAIENFLYCIENK